MMNVLGTPTYRGAGEGTGGAGFGETVTLEDVLMYLLYMFEGLSLEVQLT